MFEPLRAKAGELCLPDWPACADLNRLMEAGEAVTNAAGRQLRFVEQSLRQTAFEDGFEPRIFLRGEVQFRPHNWHDLCNALVWLTSPRAKAALNARHFRELERQRTAGAPNRGPAQDALTLFDEGGVIVASADPALAALLSGHEWKELFWRQRTRVVTHMRFYLFGHALYEKALQPFAGMTGRGVLFDVEEDFFALPPVRQLNVLDTRLAARITDPARFLATRELQPVPLLGVPGWCDGNREEQYFDDTAYFRPLRAARAQARDRR